MPVYVYKNLSTEETFEVTQSIKDDAWKVHPETGDPVKRLIQPVGIAFKGSGFYVNDSKKSSNGTSKATDKKADAKTDSKTETKTESKSETKAASKSEKKSEKKSTPKAASTS